MDCLIQLDDQGEEILKEHGYAFSVIKIEGDRKRVLCFVSREIAHYCVSSSFPHWAAPLHQLVMQTA